MALTFRDNLCKGNLSNNDELMLGRMRWLLPEDQALIQSVVIRGQSVCSVSQLMGVDAIQLRRYVRRLLRRMSSRRFEWTVTAIPHLNAQDAALAQMRFCQGATYSELAGQLGIGKYLLTRRLDQLWVEITIICRTKNVQKRQCVVRGA